jgi:triosephosphate isomerase
MKKSLRTAVIAGNWKMNKTRPQAIELINQITRDTGDVTVVVCVPYTNLETAVTAVEGTGIKVGAQNVHYANSGAFTGEISAEMLKEIGVEYVIVGHSERRQYFGETDETVNLRTKAALESGLIPIVCVGELLSEREAGITDEVLSRQTKLAFAGITAEQAARTIIAYEPVWAIGTGKTATAEEAGAACGFIRGVLGKLYSEAVARGITIQYGGSMNAANAGELLALEDVDGGLIGGASLSGDDFGIIIKAAMGESV